MLKFIPNLLTVSRIVLAFIFIPVFLSNNFEWACVVFVLASISDFLDGYIARKFQVVSSMGAMLDPIADKVLVGISYLCFAYQGIVSYYLAFVVVFRDLFIISVVAVCLIKKVGLKISPLMSSKINTTVQLIFVVLVLTCKVFAINLSLGIFEWIVLLMTVYSGVDYVIKYRWIKNEICLQ